MNRDKIAIRYFAAWNDKDLSQLLSLLHPQASYYDAFWQESCSGEHLADYLRANLELESRWYRPNNELIPTRNGMIIRYSAFDSDDQEGLAPLYNGADVLTISGGSIVTISDYYCDPTSADLIEIASFAEGQHGRANVVAKGLGRKSFGHIKRRLDNVATDSSVILDSSLTVGTLADYAGCTVMHLFNVLEDYNDTTYLDFVNECRARRASKYMLDTANGNVGLDRIAENVGFETISELDESFQAAFGVGADEYMQRFSKTMK